MLGGDLGETGKAVTPGEGPAWQTDDVYSGKQLIDKAHAEKQPLQGYQCTNQDFSTQRAG